MIYIISMRKASNTPKLGQAKYEGLGRVRRIEIQSRQVGKTPKTMQRDKDELQYLQCWDRDVGTILTAFGTAC